MQLAAIIVSLVLAVVGVALFSRAIAQIYRFVRLGQDVPAGTRTDDWTARTVTVVREFLGHTRMNRWGWSASRTGSWRSASSPSSPPW